MPNEILFEAVGKTGKILLTEDRLYIDRSLERDWTEYSQQGDKIIFLRAITALQLRPADKSWPGFLQIEFGGRTEDSFEFRNRGDKDENTVSFNQEQEPNFLKLVSLLEERIAALQAGSGAAPASYLVDIEKLAELKNKGVVTEEEFQAKKKQLLALPPAS